MELCVTNAANRGIAAYNWR